MRELTSQTTTLGGRQASDPRGIIEAMDQPDSDGRIRVRRRSIPETVLSARTEQRRADERNAASLRPRIEAHLRVAESVLATLGREHARWVDETNFDPLQNTKQSAAWLLAGRCLSLGYAVISGLRTGLTVEVAPLARAMHEASAGARIMLDGEETLLHAKWLRGSYFKPKDLDLAQKRMEQRQAESMIKQGFAPVGRTDDLDRRIYHEWSRIAHNVRSGILENYREDLRQLAIGPHPDSLRRGVWVGYGTQLMVEVTVTVGGTLAKLAGPDLWNARIEPALDAFGLLQRDHPLDPVALGFDSDESSTVVL